MLCEVLHLWPGLPLGGKNRSGFSSWLPHVRQSIVGALMTFLYRVNADELCIHTATIVTCEAVQVRFTCIVLTG
jgi:hypothetical protein